MHELAIAQSVVEFLEQERGRLGMAALKAVGLRIGELSDLVPEALEFGFQSITRGTPLETVRLDIETVPLEARCRACGEEFAVEDFFFVCPHCAATALDIIQGQDMEISYLEVEDEPET